MKWHWFDRLGLWFLIATITIGGLWLGVGSSIFLHPISLTMHGHKYVFLRETPFGDVDARWSAELTLLDRAGRASEGYECYGEGRRHVQVARRDMASGKFGKWATDCIEAGPPMVLRVRYTVMLFGMIPLRPVNFVQDIPEDRGSNEG